MLCVFCHNLKTWVKTVHTHTQLYYKWSLISTCIICKETELTASSGSSIHLWPSDCKNLLPETHLTPVLLYLQLFGQSFLSGPHKLSLTLLLCVHAKLLHFCLTLCDPFDCSPPRLLCPQDSSGKNTGGGCHALLQGISPTQGLNLCLLQLLHCKWILYCWVTGEAQSSTWCQLFQHLKPRSSPFWGFAIHQYLGIQIPSLPFTSTWSPLFDQGRGVAWENAQTDQGFSHETWTNDDNYSY